ncbi:MAG: L-lactate permease, partial [Syntrophales bacterium]|nr:L-lactate permease [Syntrophales bacterium]
MTVNELPLNITFWLSAMAPIIILLLLLIMLRWGSAAAAPVAVGAAVVVALAMFRSSGEVLAVAAGKGVWDAVFILYIIWPALLLYRTADNAGAFDSLSRGIERFSRNKLFLILAFGWIFASFLQGVAGFGTPIAVVAPLMLAIGVRPIYAVVI